MEELIIKTANSNSEETARIIKYAVDEQISSLEESMQGYRERLEKFEKKYNVTSEYFLKEWAAEDLEGQDMEYVEWAGEYKLSLVVEKELNLMKSIQYVTRVY